ncbi:MAG: ATP-binding protein [Oligoflexia bacterium]|nr:ATP-binding protein [Oligoflexia bacterium]
MAESIRHFDWSRTALGPRDEWPSALRFAVNAMLATHFPSIVLWGPQLCLLYNDPFHKIAADKHPILQPGMPAKFAWPEYWDFLGPTYDRVMQNQESVFLEDQLFSKKLQDGSFEDAWFTASHSPIYSENGQIAGIQVNLVETTERKRIMNRLHESESSLKEAQRLAHIGNWVLDLRTNIVKWSDEIHRLLEIPQEKWKSSYDVREAARIYTAMVHPDDRDRVLQERNATLVPSHPSEKSQHYEIEYRLMMRDGRIKFILAKRETDFNQNGDAIRTIGTAQDITERKALEAELRAAIEVRDEFMSVASHELKTPLTALSMQLQLLNRIALLRDADQKIVSLGKAAFLSSQSLASLLDELLDVTRIRVGKLTLDKREMDLRCAAIEAVNQFQEEAKEKGSTITVTTAPIVRGDWDPSRINQVLLNLISNAIKYGEGKPIEVALFIDHRSGNASLRVKDYGIGISTEMQTKIFERFQRAISSDKVTGLGLGLYIARQIVEAHGGSIRVESEPGMGSLFIVELPLHR